jgi:D-alanyl-D-alanine carboxypeptidase
MFASNYGAAGAMATAESVARWGHALFTGTVISDSLQRAMRTLVPAAGNIPGESGAGLGIRAYNYLGRTQYGHSGGSGYGTSLMVHDPQSGVTIAVIMSQGLDAGHFELMPTLLRIVTGG